MSNVQCPDPPARCAEHIHKVAKIQYGDTLGAQQWADATITRLFMDDTGYVIGGLKRMQPCNTEADSNRQPNHILSQGLAVAKLASSISQPLRRPHVSSNYRLAG